MSEHHKVGEGLSSQEIASELNNLLQIISGTTEMIENIWEGRPGAARYFEMLRESVSRAAEVTTDLVERSAKLGNKIVLHPDFARRKTEEAKMDPPKRRIMLVDDEKMLLILSSEMLRAAGYEVVTTQSGFECLDQFRISGRPFDLVLLDLHMPLMDGEETFQRLRAMQPDLRVMLCTGYIEQARLDRMLSGGLCGIVQKPLGPKDYLESIEDVLNRPAASSAA